MKKYFKSVWSYYYLLLILMFAALAYGHSTPPSNGIDKEGLYFNILWIHFVLGAIAIVIGPMQLSEKFRKASVSRHRKLGITYVSCVFISGIAGFWMAFNSQMPMFGYTLAILDVVWLFTTGMALYCAITRQIPNHQLWMKRSFVTTNVFVVFRFFIPIALLVTPPGQAPEYQFAIAIQIALWGMLAIFEWRRTKSMPQFAAAN